MEYYRPYGFCSRASVPNIKLVPAWTWINGAEYIGLKKFNQKRVNCWAYNVCCNQIIMQHMIGMDVNTCRIHYMISTTR